MQLIMEEFLSNAFNADKITVEEVQNCDFRYTPILLQILVSRSKYEQVLDANRSTTKSADSTKVKGELETKDDIIRQEENPKVQLQRLLETRKALLWKEQAMTYARGLVAGFAMENMEHLISFADAFGASRLREACINFKELCKKKHADRIWMQEKALNLYCSTNRIMKPLLSLVPDS